MRSALRQILLSVRFDLRVMARMSWPFLLLVAVLLVLTSLPLCGVFSAFSAFDEVEDEAEPISMFIHTPAAHRAEIEPGVSAALEVSVVFDGDPSASQVEISAPDGIRGGTWVVTRDDSLGRTGGYVPAILLDNARAVAAGVEREPSELSDVDPGVLLAPLRVMAIGLGRGLMLILFAVCLYLSSAAGIAVSAARSQGANVVTRLYTPALVLFLADSFVLLSVMHGFWVWMVPVMVGPLVLVGWYAGGLSLTSALPVVLGAVMMAACGGAAGLFIGTTCGCWTLDAKDNPLAGMGGPVALLLALPALFLLPWDGLSPLLPVVGAPAAFLGGGTLAPLGWGVQAGSAAVCVVLGAHVYAESEPLGERVWRRLRWTSPKASTHASGVKARGPDWRFSLLIAFRLHQVQWRARFIAVVLPLALMGVVLGGLSVLFSGFDTLVPEVVVQAEPAERAVLERDSNPFFRFRFASVDADVRIPAGAIDRPEWLAELPARPLIDDYLQRVGEDRRITLALGAERPQIRHPDLPEDAPLPGQDPAPDLGTGALDPVLIVDLILAWVLTGALRQGFQVSDDLREHFSGYLRMYCSPALLLGTTLIGLLIADLLVRLPSYALFFVLAGQSGMQALGSFADRLPGVLVYAPLTATGAAAAALLLDRRVAPPKKAREWLALGSLAFVVAVTWRGVAWIPLLGVGAASNGLSEGSFGPLVVHLLASIVLVALALLEVRSDR